MSSSSSTSSSTSWRYPWNIATNALLGGRSTLEAEALLKAQLEKDEVVHRKRLAAILRYIASMHQALRSADGTNGGPVFVRDMMTTTATATSSNGGDDRFGSYSHPLDFFQSSSTDDDTNSRNNNNNNSSSIMFPEDEDNDQNNFSNGSMILFSTNDFRKLMEAEAGIEGGSSSLFTSPPFSFYAATSPRSSSSVGAAAAAKKSFASSLSSSFGYGGSSKSATQQQGSGGGGGPGLWLRLTRLGPTSIAERPELVPVVENYLKLWLQESAPRGCRDVQDLLTLHYLERAPGIPSSTSRRHARLITLFLERMMKHLRMKMYLNVIEPIYNRLFEWIQQQNEHNEELVWGFGHAKQLTPDGRYINGPLLEVLVEVELAKDGAILVRPREHTGVALNREVVSALVNAAESSLVSSSTGSNVVTQLHRTVGDMESTQIAPGQPSTYVQLLKRIAVEISPGGSFQQSSSTSPRKAKKVPTNLVVTEAWCLYSRLKPSSVWARDANLLADRIGSPDRLDAVLPPATWSLTHGPSKLEEVLGLRPQQHKHQNRRVQSTAADKSNGGIIGWLSSNFLDQETLESSEDQKTKADPSMYKDLGRLRRSDKPIFPLPSSDSQHRIADLLLRQNYPAVLCEGPPGTGKTHTIANIVCAYLCQGKRVLVTSKNANALNVLRERLPSTIQELAVDVTMSELQGMRQLQQTVERLANRVSAASSQIETEKCIFLQRSIDTLEMQLEDINKKLGIQSEKLRQLLHHPFGVKLMEKSSDLIQNSPWLMQTLHSWSLEETETLYKELRALELDRNDLIMTVSGFELPPSGALISAASAKSGSKLSSILTATRSAVASIPIVGAIVDVGRVDEDMEKILVDDRRPVSEEDWEIVTNALKHAVAVHSFQTSRWRPLVSSKKWPERSFTDQSAVYEMSKLLADAVEIKRLQQDLSAEEETERISKFREMDDHRTRLAMQIQHHCSELADAAVIAELSRTFSPDAQSALIRFSQIAGGAKFNKTAKPSKMTARQRRRRQEYLDAFDRCCRFIPCWILTTSQISDYLPAECLFDLVVIDECSQSDVTVLPGMMRGKQWLIVGDGKQVSPTESFVSEDDIDNLRATLPPSPLEDALLPGRSFFDMCAQAFPQGRVVLSEHFRCAPEIIQFSNMEFYDGRLVPLRLPKRGERLAPSLVDVRIANGKKVGKVNEHEADTIVKMIREMIDEADRNLDLRSRSIGVISLMGEEQSRLIRGRLLDVCGPEKLARHDVLIGEPPSFQGAERDVVFLSMVCSPGSAPTQNQQYHFQRVNVAMSRARDRCVLVRSLDLKDIPNMDDAKIPVIEFFMQANSAAEAEDAVDDSSAIFLGSPKSDKKRFGSTLLRFLLKSRGYELVDMGIVWKNALCVEHQQSDTRVAIMVDCEESSHSEWLSMFSQSKAIERVGWKTFRVDALSLVLNHVSVLNEIVKFLSSSGIPEPSMADCPNASNKKSGKSSLGSGRKGVHADATNLQQSQVIINVDEDEDGDGIVADICALGTTQTTISDEEDRKHPAVEPTTFTFHPEKQASNSNIFVHDEPIDASRFGEVVAMDFLMHRDSSEDEDDDDNDDKEANVDVNITKKRRPGDTISSETSRVAKRPRSSATSRVQPLDDSQLARGRNKHPTELKVNTYADLPSDEDQSGDALSPSDSTRRRKSPSSRTYYPGGNGGGLECDESEPEEGGETKSVVDDDGSWREEENKEQHESEYDDDSLDDNNGDADIDADPPVEDEEDDITAHKL